MLYKVAGRPRVHGMGLWKPFKFGVCRGQKLFKAVAQIRQPQKAKAPSKRRTDQCNAVKPLVFITGDGETDELPPAAVRAALRGGFPSKSTPNGSSTREASERFPNLFQGTKQCPARFSGTTVRTVALNCLI